MYKRPTYLGPSENQDFVNLAKIRLADGSIGLGSKSLYRSKNEKFWEGPGGFLAMGLVFLDLLGIYVLSSG